MCIVSINRRLNSTGCVPYCMCARVIDVKRLGKSIVQVMLHTCCLFVPFCLCVQSQECNFFFSCFFSRFTILVEIFSFSFSYFIVFVSVCVYVFAWCFCECAPLVDSHIIVALCYLYLFMFKRCTKIAKRFGDEWKRREPYRSRTV